MWTGPPNGDVTGSRHRRNSLARCRCPATYATCPAGHPGPLPSVAPIDLHLRAGTLLAVTGPPRQSSRSALSSGLKRDCSVPAFCSIALLPLVAE